MAIYGNYVHQMDAKNRIRIPTKLRSKLSEEYPGEKLFFAAYAGKCIRVFPESVLNARLQELQARSNEPVKLCALRLIVGSLQVVEEDSQGRITLSPYLRAYAGITDEVQSYGTGDSIEMWSPDKYAEATSGMDLADAFNNVSF